MGRWSKRMKKYERWILLGLVVLLLVSFSVAGAISCLPKGDGVAPDYGGAFLETPSKRGELDHEEFLTMWRRYERLVQTTGTPSLTWNPAWFRMRVERGAPGTWMHALIVESARKVGYYCGEEQLKNEIRKVVQGVMGGLEPTDASYDLFLREQYRYGVKEFQDTVREMVIKDQYLRPLMDTPRYSISYPEAYEEWKKLLQRVNLGYVALRGDEFNLAALQYERTRERIGAQQKLLRDLAATGDTLLSLEKKAAAAEAETPATEVPATNDAWGNEIRLTRDIVEPGETVEVRSAGPDGEFGTSDDVTLDTIAELRSRAALRKVGTALMRWHGALAPVLASQTTMREVKGKLETWRDANEGSWPASLLEVYPEGEVEPRDAWERRFRYRAEDGVVTLVSAGPDGLFANDDDLTLETAALRGAWPAALADLSEAPWSGTLPPLTGDVPADGWDRALVYEGAADATPRLFSAGPDGQAGTPDDIVAVVEADEVRVPLAGALVAFLAEEENDAWDRPLRVELADAILADLATWRWSVRSAGKDGEFESEDDIDSGNEGELRGLYRQVRGEYSHPRTRRYEAAWVHMPLVPDDALRALLAAHADVKPSEQAALKTWRRLHKDTIYLADDPADLEMGHGVEQAELWSEGGTHTLVPDGAIFGEVPEDLIPADDSDLGEYIEKGWRGILLREAFFTGLFEKMLARAMKSREAHEAWRAKKAAHDEKPEEAEAPGEEPALEEFDALLAEALGEVSPVNGDGVAWIGVYRSEKPLELSEWEANEHIGDISLSLNTQQLRDPGAYAPMVMALHQNQTRAIVRNLEFNPMRQKEFEEVYDDLWDRFLEQKSMDLAVRKLDALRQAYAEAVRGAGDGAAEVPAAERWQQVFDAWAADLGDKKVTVDETGWFIGARPPRRLDDAALEAGEPDPNAADLEDRARRLRNDFVRQLGFPTIEAAVPEGTERAPGTVGSTVLRDDSGSSSAFLVRLIDAKDPPPEAFSPRDYADFLMAEILGGPKGGRALGAAAGVERVEGILPSLLKRYFVEFDWMRGAYELEPNQPIEIRK